MESEFSDRYEGWIRPYHVWLFFYLFSLILLGLAIALLETTIVFVISVSIIAGFVFFAYPIVGLICFIILSFIRPADFVPGLQALPLAKIIGGSTLLVLIIRNLRYRDFLFKNRQTYLLIALMSVLFISVPFSFWPDKSLDVSLAFMKLIVFYLLFINIARNLKVLRVVSLIALLSIIVLGISTIQSYFLGTFRAATTIGSGMYGDANDLALVMVTAIPLAYFWKGGKIGWFASFILKWGSVAILVTAIIMTQSRGGFLGLIAVFFALHMGQKNRTMRISALALTAILLIILLTSTAGERYKTIANYDQDFSAMGRLSAWQAGVKMMATRPLNGVGVGTFSAAFGTAYRPAGFSSNQWLDPHNSLIQVGAETGLIGLAIFLYMCTYSLLQLRRVRKEAERTDNKRITETCNILRASIIGFFVGAFFITQAFSFMLYFLIASIVSLSNIASVFPDNINANNSQ